MQQRHMIAASEIAEYVYCHRAWWLHHVQGKQPAGYERRKRGTALHQQHACAVGLSRSIMIMSIVLACGALLLLVLR